MRTAPKKCRKDTSGKDKIHGNSSKEYNCLSPPRSARKCVTLLRFWICYMLSFEADETSKWNPIQCPAGSMLITKKCEKPWRYTNTKLMNSDPTPSCGEVMTELMEKDNNKKNKHCNTNANKNIHIKRGKKFAIQGIVVYTAGYESKTPKYCPATPMIYRAHRRYAVFWIRDELSLLS